MRQNYPVTSEEMIVELRELQESLISLIGYDSNAFDNVTEILGSIGVMESGLSESNDSFLQSRLYSANPEYSTLYRDAYVLSILRRSINA
jgi:hypothetical protein